MFKGFHGLSGIPEPGCLKPGATPKVRPVAPMETFARFQAGFLASETFVVFVHRFAQIFFGFPFLDVHAFEQIYRFSLHFKGFQRFPECQGMDV